MKRGEILANIRRLQQQLEILLRALRKGAPTLADALRIEQVRVRHAALFPRLQGILQQARSGQLASDKKTRRAVAELVGVMEQVQAILPARHFS